MSASEDGENPMGEPKIRALQNGGFREVSPLRRGNDEDADRGVSELRAMAECYGALHLLPDEGKVRSILWIVQNFQLEEPVRGHLAAPGAASRVETESARSTPEGDLDPRAFMGVKKPQSQTERIACLAYYLTYHRGVRHFKAKDIDALNTEAAGRRLGHLSRDIDNADRQSGYIVSAGTGLKQLTMRGEAVVEALPARDAVKEAKREHGYRAKRSSGNGRKEDANGLEQE
ncbi:hypothetical protein [Amycolatopsis speibonae]|uniref:Uncharacterized protein n=1 Tax=Amycolatopsis speibonae TaxID=1450224 RepID=A0ABV7P222_9PSEU